jgi:hypothetical protein
VNPNNPFITVNWRGNHDVQPIVDPYGTANYSTSIALYSSKPDMPDERALMDAMSKAMRSVNADDPGRSQFRVAANTVLGHTPVCAQHAAWFNTNFDFVSSTRQIRKVNVRLPGTQAAVLLTPTEMEKRGGDERAALDPNGMSVLHQAYSERPVEAERMCFREFGQNYDLLKSEDTAVNERMQCGVDVYRRRGANKEYVLRLSPHAAFNLNDEQFAFTTVVMDIPWRGQVRDLMVGDSWVKTLRHRWAALPQHVRVRFEQGGIEAAADDAQYARGEFEDDDARYKSRGDGAVSDDPDEEFDDDGGVDDYDLQAERALDDSTMREKRMTTATTDATAFTDGVRVISAAKLEERRMFLPRALAETRATHEQQREAAYASDTTFRAEQREDLRAFVDRFESRQRQAYDHLTQGLMDPAAERMQVVCSGEAGTGKSDVIKAATKFADLELGYGSALVMAYTGSASSTSGAAPYIAVCASAPTTRPAVTTTTNTRIQRQSPSSAPTR